MTDLQPPRRNRAVSALFRCIGGPDARHAGGEGNVTVVSRAMHQGELRFFATLFPLTVLVAAWHALFAMLGSWPASLLCLPAALVLLQLLPFILAGRSPAMHWLLWLGAAELWAWFHRDAPWPVAAFAWTWLALAALNLAAAFLLVLRATMRWQGGGGVAWRLLLFLAVHLAAVAIGWKFSWYWAFLIGAAIAALYCLAVLRPNCQWLGDVLRHSNGKPLLTFDDGPFPETTPALLDLLDERGEKAVFFLIGENVRRHPDLVREIARRGHQIGNHTLTHPQASFWCAGPWRTAREIRGCQEILTEITGKPPEFFRAPVGHRNLFTHPVAAALGLQVVGWTRRGYDADPRTPAADVIERITSKLRDHDIILLHDRHPEICKITTAVLTISRLVS
jgi:peptidoglycan/xylan/chitin deacetylase (PgdA/CDA1 family)